MMSEPESPTRPPRPALWVLRAAIFATCAFVATASFFPGARLWGVNHLAFYSPAVRFAAIALIGVSFVPPVARRIYAGLLAASRKLKHGGKAIEIALVLIAVLSSVVFAGLSSSTNLLGDGQLVADTHHRAMQDNNQAAALVRGDRISPGTNLLYYQAARLATSRFGKTAVYGIRYLNCILGTIFVYIFLGLIRQGSYSSETRMWLLVLTLFSGTMQLFFGYIENYTPLIFLLFLYVLNSLLMLHGRGRLWVSVLLLLLAAFAHVQALVFAPSLVFLIVRSLVSRREAIKARVAPLLAVLTLSVAVVAGALTPFKAYYLPIFSTEDTQGLLSVAHWVDVANELMLLIPALPLLVVIMWIGGSLDRRAAPEHVRPDPASWFTHQDEWRFVQLIVFSCLLYLVLFKPAIGMVRDWDLFAMTSLGLIPLALLALNRLMRGIKNPSDAATFASPAILLTVIVTTAWIGINASSARSTARFEKMFDYDAVHAPYAYENLATFYYLHDDLPKAIDRLKAATAISHNPRQYLALAMYYDENGDVAAAHELLSDVLDKRPTYNDARLVLVTILARERMNEELQAVAREGTNRHPDQAVYWFHLGQSLTASGKIDEGIAALHKCLALNPATQLQANAKELLQRHTPGK